MGEKLVLSEFVKVIENVTGTNYVKAECRVHGKDVYFERIKGNLFKCAHIDHRDEEITLELKIGDRR